MSSYPGHLFVVHGRSESLVHDAAIVPVGFELAFRPYWRPLLGDSDPSAPDGWREKGWGQAGERLWLVSVGGRKYADRFDEIVRRICESVRDIKKTVPAPLGKRQLPLVAVPFVGLSGGGYGDDRGRVVRELVDRLAKLASEVQVDIALVTPDPSVYAAAQYARRDQPSPLQPDFERSAKQLGTLARTGDLALLLGAGVSIPAGLPSWHDLITMLAADIPEFQQQDVTKTHLTATDQAELIEKADKENFKRRVRSIASSRTTPSLLHALLASLGCHEVVTTNYDLLYETAVEATGHDITSVMPWDSAHGKKRWILKLHGDVKHEDKIVLTRRHMVRYDAANRPSGALLQSLLLTRHLLIVGASMTDDNVIRLAHEVQDYRDVYQEGGSGQFGSVLDTAGDRVRGRLWSDQLRWIHLPDATEANGFRALELFLDRLAMHASRNSSWLLDQRFVGLLDDPEDRARVEQAAALYALLPRTANTKWRPLVNRLEELGLREGRDRDY